MTLIHVPPGTNVPRVPPKNRPEQCPCGRTYGDTEHVPDKALLRTWRLAHAKHWEVDDA